MGSLICRFDGRMDANGVYISTADKLTWWGGNEYVDGVAYAIYGNAGMVVTTMVKLN